MAYTVLAYSYWASFHGAYGCLHKYITPTNDTDYSYVIVICNHTVLNSTTHKIILTDSYMVSQSRNNIPQLHNGLLRTTYIVYCFKLKMTLFFIPYGKKHWQ